MKCIFILLVQLKLIKPLLVLALLAGGGFYVYTQVLPKKDELKEKALTSLHEAKEKAAEVVEDSGVKDLAEEAKEAADKTAKEFKRDVLSQEVDEAIEDELAPVRAEPTPAALDPLEKIAATVTKKFNSTYPPAKEGSDLTLTTATGETVQGQVVKLNKSTILLHTETGRRTLSYSQLHQKSRVLCDADFRENILKQAIQKRQQAASL